MHRRVIDDMKKESNALKWLIIVTYVAGISFIVSMWLQFDKELLYAYIIISVAISFYGHSLYDTIGFSDLLPFVVAL